MQPSSTSRLLLVAVLFLLLLPLLPPLLRLKARGAGAARPESTTCVLGSTALRRRSPRSRSADPEGGSNGKLRRCAWQRHTCMTLATIVVFDIFK